MAHRAQQQVAPGSFKKMILGWSKNQLYEACKTNLRAAGTCLAKERDYNWQLVQVCLETCRERGLGTVFRKAYAAMDTYWREQFPRDRPDWMIPALERLLAQRDDVAAVTRREKDDEGESM